MASNTFSFIGRFLPLSQDGFQSAIETIGTKAPELWAVIAVETSGCGFFSDRRPQILHERHIFYGLTKGQFPVSDINSSDPGGYVGGRRSTID